MPNERPVEQPVVRQGPKRETARARCRAEWESVNDPPCHPDDADWRPCPLCEHPDAPRLVPASEVIRRSAEDPLRAPYIAAARLRVREWLRGLGLLV